MNSQGQSIPRFLSKKWKSIFVILAFSAISVSAFIAYFHLTLNSQLKRQLNTQREANLKNIQRIILADAESLQSINQTFFNGRIQKEIQDDTNIKTLKFQSDLLENNFFTLAKRWGIDEAVIADSKGEIIFSISNQTEPVIPTEKNSTAISTSPYLPSETKSTLVINSEIEDTNLLKIPWISESLSAKKQKEYISCQFICRQIIITPLTKNGNTIGYLLSSRPLKYIADMFYSSSKTYLGIIQPVIDKPEPNINQGKNKSAKPNWEMSLIQHWNDSTSEPMKEEISQLISKDVADETSIFKKDNRFFSLMAFPTTQEQDSPLEFVILKDITSIRSGIIFTILKNTLILGFTFFILFSVIGIIYFKNYKRIKQQIAVFPLLGEQQFHDAREVLYSNRSKAIYRDENDTLDDMMTSLSYQLESLDKAVNLRTREMERLSLFDPLTGLANRNLFIYELQSDVDRLTESDGMLAVIMIDLDNFKRLNDTLGHQYGDMLLGKIGLRLKNATRNLGMVARLGGDEFAIILRGARSFNLLEKICQKIVALTGKPIELDNHSVVINCSLGVAFATQDQSANDLIKNAEMAMYNAKKSGGNTYSVFNIAMAKKAHDNLTLESDIRRALEQKEFTLYLQPKVTMDNVIQGFEALVRWDHPERGILLPMEFIPTMESIGLINQLDDFVLDASCRQLKSIQAYFPEISIAVNISSMHFTDTNFLVYLKECLSKYPIDPSKLELEITETLLMENMNAGMEVMHEIKKMGVSIAIDDFGTGYSSLSYLKRLPVDTIKIDREFIKDIPDSERDMQISSVIIFLAKQLNFKVVAEGVETREQSVFLKANQCDLAQGFLFSRPMPAHKAMLLLESQGGKININTAENKDYESDSHFYKEKIKKNNLETSSLHQALNESNAVKNNNLSPKGDLRH